MSQLLPSQAVTDATGLWPIESKTRRILLHAVRPGTGLTLCGLYDTLTCEVSSAALDTRVCGRCRWLLARGVGR